MRLFDFQRTSGVVATITGNRRQKSGELTGGAFRRQKDHHLHDPDFPFALDRAETRRHKGKRFTMIADEAHSSQTGEAAAKLKAVFTPEEIKELKEGGEVSMDDVFAAEMSARARSLGLPSRSHGHAKGQDG